MLFGSLCHDAASERARKVGGYCRISKTPADMVPAFLTSTATVAVLDATRGMEGVHGVQPLAEPTERDGDLNYMREIPLD